jgi:pyrroloquinoline quinone biosynthesis protein A
VVFTAVLHVLQVHNEDSINKETIMWTKPAATEMRFGFEVTMYVCNK